MATKTTQARLPGTEDPEIEALQEAAMEYANVRDRRMALTTLETDAKATVLRLMKKHGKKTYNHDGIEIEVIPEDETVKVRVKKDKEE